MSVSERASDSIDAFLLIWALHKNFSGARWAHWTLSYRSSMIKSRDYSLSWKMTPMTTPYQLKIVTNVPKALRSRSSLQFLHPFQSSKKVFIGYPIFCFQTFDFDEHLDNFDCVSGGKGNVCIFWEIYIYIEFDMLYRKILRRSSWFMKWASPQRKTLLQKGLLEIFNTVYETAAYLKV